MKKSVDDVILCIEDPESSIKVFLELLAKFSHVGEYKINKNEAFLYINNEITQKEISKTIQFTITSKKIKYVDLNLTKEVKNFYKAIYSTLENES